jgi:hypothetical protein
MAEKVSNSKKYFAGKIAGITVRTLHQETDNNIKKIPLLASIYLQ